MRPINVRTAMHNAAVSLRKPRTRRRHKPSVMLERAQQRHQKALRRLALAKTLEAKWRKRITYYQTKAVAAALLGKDIPL